MCNGDIDRGVDPDVLELVEAIEKILDEDYYDFEELDFNED